MIDCIELIIKNVASDPKNICVIEGNREITYEEFSSLVSKIGTYLKANDYSKVVVNMNQGAYAYAAIVSTLLVGGYYCPLNLDSPLERKVFVINEFHPDIIITEENLLIHDSRLTKYHQTTVEDILVTVSSVMSLEQLLNKSAAELSYIIYTSGSTGDPKGVMIRRQSLNKFLEWSIKTYSCSRSDKWAQYSSLSFDLSIVDIFTALCSNCTLIPLSNMGNKLRPANTVAQYKISVWHSVPGAVDFMIQNEKAKPADLSSLRIMSFCGEPLYEYHLAYLFSKNPNLTIFNTYGPTEGTLFCTCIELNKSNYREYCDSNVSIGTSIPGWNLLLEDVADHESVKQLTIYGDYLGKGYLNIQSEAYGMRDINGRIEYSYNTGDFVKNVEGNFYFIGRGDNQIKLRGYRIELDEIDSWIMKFDGKKSVSIGYGEAIHTFIEADQVDENALRLFLEDNIEKYKIPSYFYAINRLPRNSNHKINRFELKKIIDEKR